MRSWEEGLRKEKLGIRTRVGEAEQEPSVSCIFHCLPASPGPWQRGARCDKESYFHKNRKRELVKKNISDVEKTALE